MRIDLLIAIAAAGACGPAAAAPCRLAGEAELIAVERAIDGDTALLDDGREVRLAGVEAPKPPLGIKDADWPLGPKARDALQGLVAGRVVELRPSGATDRYGRTVGQLSDIDADDHAGVAAALLSQGLARRTGESRDCDATLGEAEARAVNARLGLWSEPYYEVRNAGDGAALAAAAGRFVVAEGRVASVRSAAGRHYVNFGARWRDALSLSLSEAVLRRLGGFKGLGVEAGARLRVRGVVSARSGPVIAVTSAGQIERLSGGAR